MYTYTVLVTNLTLMKARAMDVCTCFEIIARTSLVSFYSVGAVLFLACSSMRATTKAMASAVAPGLGLDGHSNKRAKTKTQIKQMAMPLWMEVLACG